MTTHTDTTMGFPERIFIETTEIGSTDTRNRQRNLDVILYKSVIDEIANRAPQTEVVLGLFGSQKGPGFKAYYLVDYANRRGISHLSLVTNVGLWQEDHIDFILESGIERLVLLVAEESTLSTPGARRLKAECDRRQEGSTITPEILFVRTGDASAVSGSSLASTDVTCQWVRSGCAIRCDGSISACPVSREPDTVFGSLQVDTIFTAWNEHLLGFRLHHSKRELSALPHECLQCTDCHSSLDFSKQAKSAFGIPFRQALPELERDHRD